MAFNWEDVKAGGLGAIDEALFGLPEYALKKLGKRQEVEDYIKKNEKAYRTGETVGTIGSMFIPIPGAGAVKAGTMAAKGLKAAKAADTVTDLARLAKGADTVSDVGRLIKGVDTAADIGKAADTGIKLKKNIDFSKLATRGALAGGAESGVRGITSEKTPAEILKDIQTGALFGAGGGVVGGVLGNNLKRYASEAAEGAEKAYLGTTDLVRKQALAHLKDVAGAGAKGFGKLSVADKARRELVRVGKEIGAHIPGKMDEAIFENKKMWKALDDVVENAMPNVRGSEIYSEALNKLDMDALYAQFPKAEVDGFLKQVLVDGVDRSGLANSRAFLSDLIDAANNKSTIKSGKDAATQRMQKEIAKSLKTGVDEIVMDTAEKAGLNIDFNKLKKDYLPMRAFAESGAIDSIVPTKTFLGSPTMEKLAMSGAGSALGFSQGDDLETRLKNAAIGGVGGFAVKKGLEKLITKGIASTAPLAGLASDALEKIAPEVLEKAGATIGGQAGSVISRKVLDEVQPETPKEAEAAETAAVSDNEPVYLSRVLQKMQDYAIANGVDPESQEFQDFAGQVYSATGGFDPEKIGSILYTDPGEQASYLKALQVSKGLREVMPTATAKKAGLFDKATAEEDLARGTAIDKLSALVGDVAKEAGTEAYAKKALTKILNSNDDPERKAQLVKTLLSGYGVDIDELESMGVV